MTSTVIRKFTGTRLIVATHNKGKIREIADLLAPFDIEPLSAGDLGLQAPVEDGASFEENALIKAHHAANQASLPALADDSGLEIDFLGGNPGVDSALWGGEERDFGKAMDRVLSLIKDADDRKARFRCVLALAWPDGHSETFSGLISGTIARNFQGDQGFGYDPIFIPQGHEKSFAQMTSDEKKQISHRAQAFKAMIEACFES